MPSETETMTRTSPDRTAYCYKHGRLEAIKEITKTAMRSFPRRREVWAVTVTGCEVHFIGGER